MLLWSLEGASDLAVRSWEGEDELVVFDRNTGDTHLLDEFGLELIRCLQSAPQTAAGLLDNLAAFFEGGDAGQMIEYTEATLDRLQRNGLVVSSSTL